MSENKKYIGITIGPIFDMMSLVSTPAALWATSYMFSLIAKKTCEKLHSDHNKEFKIISPFYDNPENPLFNKNDGIGLFHDRIIAESFVEKPLEIIKNIKNAVLEEVSVAFGLSEGELENRILFIATEIETANGENPILKGGKILDSLELSKKVMFAETVNPILNAFTGVSSEEELEEEHSAKEGKNQKIKKIAAENLDIDTSAWPMVFHSKNSETGEVIQLIKSLPVIARAVKKSGMKKHEYFAIVRSDGDNISKIIERLPVCASADDKNGNALTLSVFSQVCLEYCSAVANLVKEFKGVPVYSSGDDLLAVMPCDSGDKGTVLDFVKEVNGKFAAMFDPFIKMIETENAKLPDDKKIAVPSLSFGISICYKKFPLYEALNDSATLLFNIAKTKKNCTAIRLQKHSGQSEGILIYNDALDDVLDLQKAVLEKESSANDILLSALYKTEQFSKLFLEATTKDSIKNLFTNTFDAPEHKNNSFLHKQLPVFYGKIRENKRIIALSENGFEEDKDDITVFNFVMRVLKFFVEKSGKEGKKDDKNV